MNNYFQHALFEHQFWLSILGDHARFIHDSLYPSEIADIEVANQFIVRFDQLSFQLGQLNETSILPFAAEVDELANELKEFKLSLLKRHITSGMKIHLTPTFINHMINELEEYQLLLNYLNQGKIPPIFHELHHHLLWLLDATGHAGTINDRLDSVEKRLKEKSHLFTKHFEQFYLKAVELTGYLRTNVDDFPALSRFNGDVEVEMGLFKTFLNELEEMGLTAEVLGIFTVSMADHMAREEQYYLTKLAQSKSV